MTLERRLENPTLEFKCVFVVWGSVLDQGFDVARNCLVAYSSSGRRHHQGCLKKEEQRASPKTALLNNQDRSLHAILAERVDM